MKRSVRTQSIHHLSASALKCLSVLAVGLIAGCAPEIIPNPYVPSRRYATVASPGSANLPELQEERRANWKGGFVEEKIDEDRARIRAAEAPPAVVAMTVRPAQFKGDTQDLGPDVNIMKSSERASLGYRGPLDIGDPGVTASLFRESQVGNDPFRDYRAWQPMDLVTIVVTEQSLGQQLANTEVKSKSEYLAAIENFFGLEKQTQDWTNKPDLTSLIQAQTKNDFRGEGRTLRQAQLNARVSAVVAEVLPSGLLRIEGEKIIAVNNEEQVLVISGLVRQRDINSNNEVNASQIAQVRIDYYGKGTVGEAQYGGWLSRLLRILWPF